MRKINQRKWACLTILTLALGCRGSSSKTGDGDQKPPSNGARITVRTLDGLDALKSANTLDQDIVIDLDTPGDVTFPNLKTAKSIKLTGKGKTASFPALESVDVLAIQRSEYTYVSAPALTTAKSLSVQFNPQLAELSAVKLGQTTKAIPGDVIISHNARIGDLKKLLQNIESVGCTSLTGGECDSLRFENGDLKLTDNPVADLGVQLDYVGSFKEVAGTVELGYDGVGSTANPVLDIDEQLSAPDTTEITIPPAILLGSKAKQTKFTTVELGIVAAGGLSISGYLDVVSITTPKLERVGAVTLTNNTRLQEFDLGLVTLIAGPVRLMELPMLKNISFDSVTKIEGNLVVAATGAELLDLGLVTAVGRLLVIDNAQLSRISGRSLAKAAKSVSIISNAKLATFNTPVLFGDGIDVFGMFDNPSLTTITWPEEANVGRIVFRNSNKSTSLCAPVCARDAAHRNTDCDCPPAVVGLK